MTLTLCGFALSNYYNKVKLVLLEKGLAFEEHCLSSNMLKTDEVLAESPLGKIPYLRTAAGHAVREPGDRRLPRSSSHPTPPLLPADAWAAAKVRELCTFLDLHLELVARELYGQAFFGGTVSEAHAGTRAQAADKNIAGFKRLAQLWPLCRRRPLHAGRLLRPMCTCRWSRWRSKRCCGEDLLAAPASTGRPTSRLVGERPSAQRVDADRKADRGAIGRRAAATRIRQCQSPALRRASVAPTPCGSG